MISKKAHNNKFSFRKRLRSFIFAFNGITILWKEEHNFRIHLVATILVIISGIAFKISKHEWIAVILSIGLVFVAEIINTSIENLSDFVSPGENEQIKKIKDISAAGVLIAAIIAFTIGMIIFLPKIFRLIFY